MKVHTEKALRGTLSVAVLRGRPPRNATPVESRQQVKGREGENGQKPEWQLVLPLVAPSDIFSLSLVDALLDLQVALLLLYADRLVVIYGDGC